MHSYSRWQSGGLILTTQYRGKQEEQPSIVHDLGECVCLRTSYVSRRLKQNLLLGCYLGGRNDLAINTVSLLRASAHLHKGLNNLRTGPLKCERAVTRI